jgi:hypothetical protein
LVWLQCIITAFMMMLSKCLHVSVGFTKHFDVFRGEDLYTMLTLYAVNSS